MKIDIKQIETYAQKEGVFTIEDIADFFQLTDENRNAFRIMMSRLQKKGVLHRFERGLYGYNSFNPFIKETCRPSDYDVINKIYLGDNIGYVSGGHYLNSIGLTTWCPAIRIVVSNRVKRKEKKYGAMIRQPKTKITEKNKPYLQLLDGMEDAKKLPIDCPNPDKIFFRLIEQNDLEYLLFLAQNFYPHDIVEKIVEIIAQQYKEV